MKSTFAILLGIAVGGPGLAQEPLSVFVSIEPQAYLVERIGGEFVKVETLLPAGASEHSYEPKPSQLAALAEADIYFTIGLPFEAAFLESIASASPPVRVVNMSLEIDRIPLDKEHRHEGEFYDPHIWLSPVNLLKMAPKVHRDIITLHPDGRLQMRKNLSSISQELILLKADMDKWFGGYKGRSFFVFHPSYGYFAQDVGLNQVAIEHEGKEPTGKGLAQIIEKARQAEVKSVFVQPQFASSSAEAVAKEIGAKVETLDPLAKDVIANLKEISRKILESFQSEKE